MTDAARRPHGYWIILAGNTPTSFRARTRDVLVPTFVQLRRTQPDVSLKWFERSRIWNSPGEARDALFAQRQQPRRRERPPDWRPGGEHQDPRKRFELSRDQKRARFKARQRNNPPTAGGGPTSAARRPDRQGPQHGFPARRPGVSTGKSASSRRWPEKHAKRPGRPAGGPRKPGGGSRGPR